jgi:outer membrane protein assembly factor BamD
MVKFMKLCKYFLLCFTSMVLIACASENRSVDAFKNMQAAQILASGERAIVKHNYQDAIKSFEAIDVLYPFAKEIAQSQLDIIYAYYKIADYESAIAAADRYIHLYPNEAHTDYAYYMKGIINFDRGKSWLQKIYPLDPEQQDLTYLKKAFVVLGDLIKMFPNSKYVHDAKTRMIYIRELIAKREINTAKYYFKRKAYIAAVNRASEVVQHFENSPQIKAALQIMVDSYRALGEEQHAKETQRILNMNPHNNDHKN